VAKAIHCAYPAATWIVGLADALKAYCRVAGWMDRKNGSLLQLVGTQVFRRQVKESHWYDCAQLWMDEVADDYGCHYFLVPDIRFPDEAEWVKSKGGLLVKVERILEGGAQFIAKDRDPKHESETALDEFKDWDVTIAARDGNLEALRTHATEWFKSVYRPYF
jgi:hypothetical protein